MMQPGDIVFYRVTPKSFFVSKIIAIAALLSGRGYSNTLYSHVAILTTCDPLRQAEATWPKTRISDVHIDKPIEIWQLQGITDAQRCCVIDWCNKNLGEWYDLGMFLLGWADIHHAEICTSFVAKAYAAAGIPLGRGKRFNFPSELLDARLVKVWESKAS